MSELLPSLTVAEAAERASQVEAVDAETLAAATTIVQDVRRRGDLALRSADCRRPFQRSGLDH